MEIKKFTTYEFELNVGGVKYMIEYKKDESNAVAEDNSSFVRARHGDEVQSFNVSFLMALYDAMKEVDPFGFVFEDVLGEDN